MSDEVRDNPPESRFEIEVDGHRGVLEYHRSGKRLVLIHTEVPHALEGRGIAGQLVRTAVDAAETDGLTVVPRCPYARAWLERHPDDAARVSIDWATTGSARDSGG
ncbi:MAG TPA: GNAT family N-acetyltransferase [Acidimicrobiia bacterium]|nr:GNAT family N-acetyltransferase [Acidimicrobiia bacterium]